MIIEFELIRLVVFGFLGILGIRVIVFFVLKIDMCIYKYICVYFFIFNIYNL